MHDNAESTGGRLRAHAGIHGTEGGGMGSMAMLMELMTAMTDGRGMEDGALGMLMTVRGNGRMRSVAVLDTMPCVRRE